VRAFSSRLQEFLYSRSCAVAFASTDSEFCLRAWNAASEMEGGLGGVHVPLISDCNHKLSRDYGVLIEDEGVPERALFIIDPKGKIRSMTINDADVGRSVDEAQRILDALVFKDEFGEGCPVDWKKGDKGIDIAAKSKVEGPIDVRKSWVEWARPKLARTWSGASHTSSKSMSNIPSSGGPIRYNSSGNLLGLSASHAEPPRSTGIASGSQSPVSITPSMARQNTQSPTSSLHVPSAARNNAQSPVFSPINDSGRMETQMTQAMMQQQLDNMQAALTNQKLGHDIGLAS
jgi:alkyl hydroperoxide reductase subunit AhpC